MGSAAHRLNHFFRIFTLAASSPYNCNPNTCSIKITYELYASFIVSAFQMAF